MDQAGDYLVPIALFGALAVLALRLKWRRWVVIACSVLAAWGIAGLLMTHFLFGLNVPVGLPTEQFLSSGGGRVVDIGAGSGRASIGLLLARPRVTVTAVDIYTGYYGIDDNTPDRFMLNARIAGVADRAEAKVGDARELATCYAAPMTAPSAWPRSIICRAPAFRKRWPRRRGSSSLDGEFLLMIVNVDAWAMFASPHAFGIIPRRMPIDGGRCSNPQASTIVEQGTRPAMLLLSYAEAGPSSRSSS